MGDSVLGSTATLENVAQMLLYEATTLRPMWDRISTDAEKRAGVTNWDSAPASAWDREATAIYSDRVVSWASRIPRTLEELDPTGAMADVDLVSLRNRFDFHVRKLIHLQELGLSLRQVPSTIEAAWKGLKAGAADVGEFLGAPFGPSWEAIAIGGAIVLAIVLFREV